MQSQVTKFILHGGFNSEKSDEDNSPFYIEILKSAPQNASILLVPFAKDADRILPATVKVSKEFENAKSQKNLAIEVATESTLIEQIHSSNVIYFHGGVSLKLLDALKKYPDLDESLRGKIVAGESAGANVWGKYFYSPKSDTVSEGLGILPIKICPHYKQEYERKLDDVGIDVEELLLPEYQFKTFEK